MKAYNGFKPTKITSNEPLPAGGYVVRILDAKEVITDKADYLQISFDVIEGEYKNFFADKYKNRSDENKKWQGVVNQFIPKDDGTDKDAWTKRSFENMMYAFENSNNYKWNWDERTLKGLVVGALYREKEWEFNGNSGITTECSGFIPVDDVKSGNFKIPKPKMLKKKETASNSTAFDSIVSPFDMTDNTDLPF